MGRTLTLTTTLAVLLSQSCGFLSNGLIHQGQALAAQPVARTAISNFAPQPQSQSLLAQAQIQVPIETPRRKRRGDKDKKPTKIVQATDVKLVSENIAGAWFYTLTGNVLNTTEATVRDVIVNYEIVAPDSGKLLAAGSAVVNPNQLQNGGQGRFMVSPNAGGNVRVTLVEWSFADKTYGSYPQMQVFP